MLIRHSPIAIFLALAPAGSLEAAPPTLDRLFPAGVQRGQQTDVAAEGKFDTWPVRVWSESAGLRFEVLEEKGKLRVTAADDLACGIHWLRLYAADGASALRPLVVSNTPEQMEQEPNETLDKAQSLALPSILNGRLQKRGDVDTYGIQLEAGQQLVVSLGANMRIGSPMDGVVQLVSSQGFVVEQNDDSHGIDPLVAFKAPSSGRYFVRVFGFPETPNQQIAFGGGDSFVYRLAVTTDGFLDHALPLAISTREPSGLRPLGWNVPERVSELDRQDDADRPFAHVFHSALLSSLSLPRVDCPSLVVDSDCAADKPQVIAPPVVLSGHIEAAGDVDVFQFSAREGDQIAAEVEAESLGSLLDPHVTLFDAAGKVLAEADDTGRRRDCVLQHKMPADGTFRLQLRDVFRHGGFRYFYRLTVRPVRPEFRLSVSADSVVVGGEPVEVSIAVDRRDGFNLPIEVTAVDLPEFVKVSPVVSQPEGDSSKTVKLKFSATAGTHTGVFRIRGTSRGDEPRERFAAFRIDRPAREVERLWLTVRESE